MTPQNFVSLPREVVERAIESLGSFVSDHGWAQSDMDTMDTLIAALKEQVQPAQGEREAFNKGRDYEEQIWRARIEPTKQEAQMYKQQYFTLLEHIANFQALQPRPPIILQSNAERVPLSDERIIELNDAAFDKYITQDARALEFARAIEAEITKGQQ